MKIVKYLVYLLSFLLIVLVGMRVSGESIDDVFKKDMIYSIVSPDGEYYGVLDSDGEWIIEPNKFKGIQPFSNGLAAATANEENWGYIDMDGEWVILPSSKYESAGGFSSEHLARVYDEDGKVMLIDRDNESVFPFQDNVMYDSAFSKNNLAIIKIMNEEEILFGFGDANGKVVIKPDYKSVEEFADCNLALVQKDNDRYGYINEKGSFVIAAIYEQAKSFGYHDLAPVYDGEKWGYIDTDGELAIDYKYKSAEPFTENGLALVSIMKDDEQFFGYIDTDGNTKIEFEYEVADVFMDFD